MKIKILALLLAALTLSACGSRANKLNKAGNEAFDQQQYEAALANYESASREEPDLAAPVYNRANVHYRQGQFADAGAALRTAMLRGDTKLTQQGHYNLGNTLFNEGDFAGAVEAYKQALRLDPNDMDAKVNLELALQQLQQQEQEPEQPEEQQDEQQDQPQDQQEQQDDPQGGQSDENQEENSDQSDTPQDDQNGESQQDEQEQESQDQEPGEQNEAPAPEPETPGEEQSSGEGEQEEEQAQPQPEGDQPQEQSPPPAAPPPAAPPPAAPPPPQQAGASGNDQQAQVQPGPGRPMPLRGLTEEQARQLLQAASQDTETLQEYLQQIYVFPYAEVQNDW